MHLPRVSGGVYFFLPLRFLLCLFHFRLEFRFVVLIVLCTCLSASSKLRRPVRLTAPSLSLRILPSSASSVGFMSGRAWRCGGTRRHVVTRRERFQSHLIRGSTRCCPSLLPELVTAPAAGTERGDIKKKKKPRREPRPSARGGHAASKARTGLVGQPRPPWLFSVADVAAIHRMPSTV